jgi:hypothetical protein
MKSFRGSLQEHFKATRIVSHGASKSIPYVCGNYSMAHERLTHPARTAHNSLSSGPPGTEGKNATLQRYLFAESLSRTNHQSLLPSKVGKSLCHGWKVSRDMFSLDGNKRDAQLQEKKQRNRFLSTVRY